MERMNIEHKIYLVESKIPKNPETREIDKFIIILNECVKDGDIIIDSMYQIDNKYERSVKIKHGKKTTIITETDDNWKSMFGLLTVTNIIDDGDIHKEENQGMQSAMSAVLIVYLWLL